MGASAFGQLNLDAVVTCVHGVVTEHYVLKMQGVRWLNKWQTTQKTDGFQRNAVEAIGAFQNALDLEGSSVITSFTRA